MGSGGYYRVEAVLDPQVKEAVAQFARAGELLRGL
jgi:hypothetical protein